MPAVNPNRKTGASANDSGLSADSADGVPQKIVLKLPQVRVLKALSESYLLTVSQIKEACGLSAQSGTVTNAINGIKEGSSHSGPFLGLVDLGLVERIDVNNEGILEKCLKITKAGRAALKEVGSELRPVKGKKEPQ